MELNAVVYPVGVMSTERGAAERGPPARKVSLGALKVSSSFLPFPWGLFALSLALALALSLEAAAAVPELTRSVSPKIRTNENLEERERGS